MFYPAGVYEYTFTEAGVNPYWSGYVTDESMITLRGEVEVVPRTSQVAFLKVSRGDYEAEYNTASGKDLHVSCVVSQEDYEIMPMITSLFHLTIGLK